jgi:hypothetical protein
MYDPGSTTNMPWYLASVRDANHRRLEAERDEARTDANEEYFQYLDDITRLLEQRNEARIDAAESWRAWEKAIFERAEARLWACRLMAEKQMLEAERDMAQGSGDYADVAALLTALQEILDKNQARRFLGALLKLPPHLRERLSWPGKV